VVGCATALILSAALLVSPTRAIAQGHFDRPDQACRAHLPQNPATTTPPGLAGQSWQSICRVSNYMTGTPPAYFNPESQYKGVPACGAEPWPRCVCPGNPACPLPEPDKGFRYPLVDDSGMRERQEPAIDWWSVCASADLSEIVSVPGNKSCGSLLEVGQCRASAGYHERLKQKDIYTYPAETFYSFVFTHPDCQRCGHDLLSVIMACKETCRHYFGNLGFDQDFIPPESPTYGVWRDGNDPVWNTRPPGKQFCDVALHRKVIGGTTWVAGKTALQACVDFCGPPVGDCDPPSATCGPPVCEFGVRGAPPWVSSYSPPPEEKDNQWYWVSYQRGSVVNRNPNEVLSLWLRSYAVNTDHSSPSPECRAPIISQYCNTIIPTGTPNRDAKRAECKKNLLPGTVDLDGDGNADGEILLGLKAGTVDTRWNLATDGFCEAFSHAHLFCRDVCYDAGGNGEKSTHVCGLVTTQVGLVGLPGSACDNATALCQCNDGLGNVVPCIDICGHPLNPPSPDLPCNDGNTLDGDCCSAACTYEPDGAACEADANPCTGGTCNATGTCDESGEANCRSGNTLLCGGTCAWDGSACLCQ
jgi:hypothetical protein